MKVVLLIALIFLTGCSTWGTKVPMGGQRYPKVPVDHVMILFESPERAHRQIGIVSSLGGVFASEGDMYRKMQMAAADLGADAVVVREKGATVQNTGGVTVVQSQEVRNYWDYPKSHGIAIKFE